MTKTIHTLLAPAMILVMLATAASAQTTGGMPPPSIRVVGEPAAWIALCTPQKQAVIQGASRVLTDPSAIVIDSSPD